MCQSRSPRYRDSSGLRWRQYGKGRVLLTDTLFDIIAHPVLVVFEFVCCWLFRTISRFLRFNSYSCICRVVPWTHDTHHWWHFYFLSCIILVVRGRVPSQTNSRKSIHFLPYSHISSWYLRRLQVPDCTHGGWCYSWEHLLGLRDSFEWI